MTFGLTSTGFNVKRLSDIQDSMNISARSNINAQLRTDAQSVFGQARDVFANELADLWEQTENVYNSQNPDDADNVALDRAVSINGLLRNPPTSTRVKVGINEPQNTAFLQGEISSVSDVNGEEFRNAIGFTVDFTNQTSYGIRVDEVTANTVYSVTIRGTLVSINSGETPTAASIAASLSGAINSSNLGITSSYIQGGDISLSSTYGFNILGSDNVKLYYFTYFDAVNVGKITAIYGSLVGVSTETYNFEDGVLGSELETDIELRARREDSFSVTGSATINALEARIKNEVDGVTDCKVYENDTDVTADGIPPHSYHIIVVGGNPTEIAQKILEVKSGGIGTYGNVTETVYDTKGNAYQIKFSIPTTKNIYVRINLTLLAATEGVFPSTGVQDIKNAVRDYINLSKVGKDLVQQTLFVPVYSVPGVAYAEVLIGVAPSPTTQTNIVIAPYEIARTTTGLISTNMDNSGDTYDVELLIVSTIYPVTPEGELYVLSQLQEWQETFAVDQTLTWMEISEYLVSLGYYEGYPSDYLGGGQGFVFNASHLGESLGHTIIPDSGTKIVFTDLHLAIPAG